MKLLIKLITLTIMFSIFSVIASAQIEKVVDNQTPFLAGKSPQEIEDRISKMSGAPMFLLAEKHGIKTVKGKSIAQMAKSVPAPRAIQDRPVGVDPDKHENEPSIAVKPNNPNVVVVASHSFPNTPENCAVFRSTDKGETWSDRISLPLRFSTDFCSDPVIRYVPNSSAVFVAYMSIRDDGSTADIMVSKSTNDGSTWGTPKIAIEGNDTTFPDKPWLDVHTFATLTAASARLYVTATAFDSGGNDRIVLARSINSGTSFLAPQTLASTTSAGPVIQGSRPIGGKFSSSSSGTVLACWYNSNDDGWLNGSFSIRCKSSADNGVSFGPETIAANSANIGKFELPFFLGPDSFYHRWWAGMFPSMIISKDNTAHLVFTADPVEGSDDSEDGDIYYIRSLAPPYSSWSVPNKISDDTTNKAQGYPTITSKRIVGGSVLVANWEDHRNSPASGPIPGIECGGDGTDGRNCIYDTFSAITNPAFLTHPNQRVTDASSVSDFIFLGDYIDSSTSRTTSDRTAHVVWTDRSDKASIMDFEDDVLSDMLDV